MMYFGTHTPRGDIRGRVLRLAKIHQRLTPPSTAQLAHYINSSPVFIHTRRNRSRRRALGGRKIPGPGPRRRPRSACDAASAAAAQKASSSRGAGTGASAFVMSRRLPGEFCGASAFGGASRLLAAPGEFGPAPGEAGAAPSRGPSCGALLSSIFGTSPCAIGSFRHRAAALKPVLIFPPSSSSLLKEPAHGE